MKKRHFAIRTYGCQMNDHESEILKNLLKDAGHVEAPSEEEADLILFNTCAVRAKAEQKVYSELGKLRPLKAERPDLLLAVGGCMAQSEGRKIFSHAPFVDIVFGTKTLHKVAQMIERVAEDKKRLASTSMEENAQEVEAFYSHAKGDGLKAFVTVMQGCDNFCSYCIVPHVRGREISRPSADIVEEIKRLAEGGIREVTLLGQNVNSYGLKGGDGADFPSLVRRVAAIEGILRIRFTTSHPKDLSEELIALFAQEEKLMPHLHLPVQSGSDEILKAMNRGYDTAHYLGLVEKIRRVAPKIALTSDMIVGFPGETDEDFAATLKIMEEVRFDNLFSFKYSPRSHTAAQKLSGQVAEKVKDQRLAELQSMQKEHTLARNRQWLGEVRPVMCEGPSKAGKGQLMGRTPENKIVNFTRPEAGPGEVVNLTVVEAYVNSLIGRPPELEDQCS